MAVRIKSTREVASFTALITAFAVLLPLGVVWTVFALSAEQFSPSFVASGMLIAGIVPLLITPPIAWVILSLLRTQADMIRMVDERIMFDMLTGTFNRNHFLDRVRASQQGGPIMIVDADYFKSINDTHGHAIGDEALRILANALCKSIGSDGVVGRLGGEEFGIFMPGKSEHDGHSRADAICAAVRGLHPFIQGKQIKLSVSIGCAYHRPNRVIGHSLKLADDLLYRAKAEGRDRALFDPGLDERRSA
jgi:diguanylate cyclase